MVWRIWWQGGHIRGLLEGFDVTSHVCVEVIVHGVGVGFLVLASFATSPSPAFASLSSLLLGLGRR